MASTDSSSEAVFVHIVTFNSSKFISRCLESLGTQGVRSVIQVTDNASSDNTCELIKDKAELFINGENFGFCAAHNQGVKRFLDSNCNYLLILNPDINLTKSCIKELRDVLSEGQCGLATPKLLRCDDNLTPLPIPTIDAAGMVLKSSLRHFDRGGGEVDGQKFADKGLVFGGTGACLMLTRSCVLELLLDSSEYDPALTQIYPRIPSPDHSRSPLFDEAFFAYREDADLAWRAQSLGLNCVYQPKAVAYHRRVVTPERRAQLSPLINMLGVQNRFLLQINNFDPGSNFSALLFGFYLRNLLVVLGVLIFERSSLVAFKNIWALRTRALKRRAMIKEKQKRSQKEVLRWLNKEIE